MNIVKIEKNLNNNQRKEKKKKKKMNTARFKMKMLFYFALLLLIQNGCSFSLKLNDLCLRRKESKEGIERMTCKETTDGGNGVYLVACDTDYCSTTVNACRIFKKFRMKSAKLERLNYFSPLHTTQHYKRFIDNVPSCFQQTSKKRKSFLKTQNWRKLETK
jgi:hypothetical protein